MRQSTHSTDKETIIWFFNQNAYSPDMPGSTRHFDFAKILGKHKVKSYIFASNFHGFTRKKIRNFKKRYLHEKIEGVNFVWISSLEYKKNDLKRAINMLLYSVRLYRVATKINLPKPNIIVGSSPHLLNALSAYFISKFYRVPYIFEIRDIWPQTLVDLGKNKYNPLILSMYIIESFLNKRADKFVVLMPSGDKYLLTKGVKKENITWISNGVNLKLATRNVKAKITFDPKYFNICFAGTIGVANGIETILKSAIILEKKYPRIRITMIGSGERRDWLIENINRHKLSNIYVFEPIAKKDIFAVMQKADALLFTSNKGDIYQYGHPPNKLFDYFACSKPVIFSSSASNDLVKESKSGISIAAESPVLLARACVHMTTLSKKERLRMGKSAFALAKKEYEVGFLGEKYLKLIKSILAF